MTEAERRRFFRIDDEVAIHFTPMDEGYGGESIDVHPPTLNHEFHLSLEGQIRQAMVEVQPIPKSGAGIGLIKSEDQLTSSGGKPRRRSACFKAGQLECLRHSIYLARGPAY